MLGAVQVSVVSRKFYKTMPLTTDVDACECEAERTDRSIEMIALIPEESPMSSLVSVRARALII